MGGRVKYRIVKGSCKGVSFDERDPRLLRAARSSIGRQKSTPVTPAPMFFKERNTQIASAASDIENPRIGDRQWRSFSTTFFRQRLINIPDSR